MCNKRDSGLFKNTAAGMEGLAFNMFPIDLSGKKFDAFGGHPLRLEIELSTQPLTDVWYLGKSYPDLHHHHPWLKG